MAFTADGVIVRKLENLTIVFWDSESIWVKDKKGQNYIFHRWFAPRGSYRGYIGGEKTPIQWGTFRRKMLRNKYKTIGAKEPITLESLCVLANKYGVLVTRTTRELNLKGRKVIYRK